MESNLLELMYILSDMTACIRSQLEHGMFINAYNMLKEMQETVNDFTKQEEKNNEKDKLST